MTVSNSQLLAFVVSLYDERGRPVTPETAAVRFDADAVAVRRAFDSLVECELVAGDGSGYRPTVTGREFLDLDVSGDLVIVDADGDGDATEPPAKF